MANQWLRLWIDLPNDPKFRTVSRISKQPISMVISVYIHMLCCAANATERGRTQGWCDEDIATALDAEIDQIVSIKEAMQGRLLDVDHLTGWEKRQPIKEDGADLRAKKWREEKKNKDKESEEALNCSENASERKRTQTNANERKRTLEEIREEEIRIDEKKDIKKIEASRGSRLASDWVAPFEFIDFCKKERPDLDHRFVENKFRDYWSSLPGRAALKTDWLATWRNFVRSERAPPKNNRFNDNKIYGLGKEKTTEEAMLWLEMMEGGRENECSIIDIN